MPKELIHFTSRNPVVRVLMILFLIAAAVWCYFACRWYLGNTFAELGPGEQDLKVARLAVSFAPDDPLARWRLAVVSQSKLPLNQIGESIAEYERAVSLSPNDYRFWTALGVAYEQSGEPDKGEIALKRAVSLAPAYAQPHWYLGNLLLRRARYDEAFAELRLASDANEELRPQLFTFVAEIYGSDFDSLSKAVGDKPSTRAEFALYLLRQNRVEEALRLWSMLSQNDKVANKATAEALVTTLLKSQRYYLALNLWNGIAPNPQNRAVVDQMFDGGFEQHTDYGQDMVFAWQVKSAQQLQIGVDPTVAHSGARSLRLVFQVRLKLSSVHASQLVAVSPDTQYDFEFYRKSQKLESGSTPVVQVTNAADGALLIASDGAPTGSSDWQRVSLSFKTPPKSEAVVVSIERVQCLDTDICPIFGTVWYDDFSFKRRN
jgi:TPR repeat